MASGVNGKSIAVTAGGGLLMYAGIKGLTIRQEIRALLSGKNPASLTTDNPITPQQSASLTQVLTGNAPSASAPGKGPLSFLNPKNIGKAPIVAAPTGTNAAKNQSIGRLLAASYGWGAGKQWADLIALWNQESGWSNTAKNAQSGAYGIAQALPPTKMPKIAQEPVSSATAQISWGLKYIKDRYGSPSNAWAHEQSAGWY